MCTVTEWNLDDAGKIKNVKIRIEAFDSEGVIDGQTDEINNLITDVDVNVRIVQKSGTKLNVKYKYVLSLNMRENLK